MEMKSILRAMDHAAAGLVVVCGICLSFNDTLFAGLGSVAMIVVGIASLMYLRFQWLLSEVQANDTVDAKCPTRKVSRLKSQKCPKPIIPTGPIHVVEVSEETSVERIDKRVRSETNQIGSPSWNVPETIAAIWETVPGDHGSSNIWSSKT